MSQCRVNQCGQPCRPSTSVCTDHLEEVRREMLHVPSIAQALESARTKSLRLGGHRPDRPRDLDESPLPWSDGASRAESAFLRDLGIAATALGRRLGTRPPADLSSLGPWLARAAVTLRDEPEQVAFLIRLVRWGSAVVDRPEDLVYLGPCDSWISASARCDRDLYAKASEGEVTCWDCGNTILVRGRREKLRRRAESSLAPASDIARALTTLGAPVTPKTIQKWVERGRLSARGTRVVDGRSVRLFRVGDVEKLALENEQRRARLVRRVASKVPGA